MTNNIVEVKNISKRFSIGKKKPYYTLRESIAEGFSNFFIKKNNVDFWALRNVSFNVAKGEMIGIIGGNGAGKSTLLKILSRITPPTSGEINIRGSLVSLLEVGTGFHPELTGRENIFFNGSLLGMKRSEIRQKFNDIVEFAGIEKFIDTPVKRFSSGMYVRLAFAVAAHLESDILLIDEVLAVGDMEFQKKCIGKMDEVTRKQGKTVIFVSHNIGLISKLCSKAILLDKGGIVTMGKTNQVISKYLSMGVGQSGGIRNRTDREGSGEMRIVDIYMTNQNNKKIVICSSGSSITFNFVFKLNSPISKIYTGFILRNNTGEPVFTLNSRLTGDEFGLVNKDGKFRCVIQKLHLKPGEYYLNISLMHKLGLGGEYIDNVERAYKFTVDGSLIYHTGEVPHDEHGQYLEEGKWEII